jgi:hypothetical protein
VAVKHLLPDPRSRLRGDVAVDLHGESGGVGKDVVG